MRAAISSAWHWVSACAPGIKIAVPTHIAWNKRFMLKLIRMPITRTCAESETNGFNPTTLWTADKAGVLFLQSKRFLNAAIFQIL
jgi:hypothetical protein